MITSLLDELILIKILAEQWGLELVSLSIELPDGSKVVLE